MRTPSDRTRLAAAMLGLDVMDAVTLDPHSLRKSPDATRPRWGPRDRIALVLGPSGSGKSTLLRAEAHRAARATGTRVRTIGLGTNPFAGRSADRHQTRSLIDLFARFSPSVEFAMRALAKAGLAEGRIFVRPARELSTGQRFRLDLALALADLSREDAPIKGKSLLVIDEFASSLDPVTAWAVASLLRRAVNESPGARVLIATNREELREALEPDMVIELDLSHRLRRDTNGTRSRRSRRPTVSISAGDRRDYEALASHHYRAGAPATIVRVLVARDSGSFNRGGATVGVLVVSMPVLNGRWRALAWPGRFDSGRKRADARRLNHPRMGVRCISRVIVDPRYRSFGVATSLVRAYLADPITRHTEALASMGRFTTFFDSAGMTRLVLPPNAAKGRLLDLFEQYGLPPQSLASPDRAWRNAHRRIHRSMLHDELRRWARSSRLDAGESMKAVFRAACRSLAEGANLHAFVHASAPAAWGEPRGPCSCPDPPESPKTPARCRTR